MKLLGISILCAAAIVGAMPGAMAAAAGGWRNITPQEEQFVQLVEKRVYAVLRGSDRQSLRIVCAH